MSALRRIDELSSLALMPRMRSKQGLPEVNASPSFSKMGRVGTFDHVVGRCVISDGIDLFNPNQLSYLKFWDVPIPQ
jgi:hypothetical protein